MEVKRANQSCVYKHMFTDNDNKKWVHFSWKGAALIRRRPFLGGGGEVNTVIVKLIHILIFVS